jgi:general secretion pathway protein I
MIRRMMVQRSVRRSLSGFTLIEVLVALTIAAVALIAALRATATLTQGAQDMRLRAYALWSAENRLATIRLSSEWPEVGRRRFDCPQGGVALRCEEEVFATPNLFFRRVEISVRAADAPVESDAPRLARLVGFATNVPGG